MCAAAALPGEFIIDEQAASMTLLLLYCQDCLTITHKIHHIYSLHNQQLLLDVLLAAEHGLTPSSAAAILLPLSCKHVAPPAAAP
jgi:hypothetical protein